MRKLALILVFLLATVEGNASAPQNASVGGNASVGENASAELPPGSASVKIVIPPTADAIMQAAFDRDDGKDSYAKIEMVLIDKTGSQRKRILEMSRKDYGAMIKTFIKFDEPADIKGTSFLSWENEGTDDTQYLYLPELGRVRRIVSSQKNLRFVNTDFSYEDMQRRRPEKDKHNLVGEETVAGQTCFVVESLPKNNSQYYKRVSWVDKESCVIVRVDFYDRKGSKFKIFRVVNLKKISDIWTPMLTTMENLKENHKTSMLVLGVSYNQGLGDALFTQENLEKK